MADSLREQLQKPLDQLSNSVALSGRYGRQKLMVLGAYLLACLVTIGWSLSTPLNLTNAIGAKVELNVVDTSNETWFLLRNESDTDWTNVSLTLNGEYLHTDLKNLPAGNSERVLTQDFQFLLYVPRAQHLGTFEDATATPPGPYAPKTLKPRALTIETDQGRHTQKF